MSALPLPAAIAASRLAGALSKLRGGGATSVPGVVLNRLRPDAISLLAKRLPEGSVIVSATNGKTTTAALAAGILQRKGVSLVHNSAGANMPGGVAASLMQATGRAGSAAQAGRAGRAASPHRLAGELGLFEVDEAWLAPLAEQLRPRVIVLGNLFRDQLDRYGELQAIAERWQQTVSTGAGAQAQLLLNADDPLVADLGRNRDKVLWFGIEDDAVASQSLSHAADAKRCRGCGGAYVFDAVYLGHLGRYHCPSCGRRRPKPQVHASQIELHGVESSAFTLTLPQGVVRVELPLPGLYNVYNALAAAALASALGTQPQQIAAALRESRAAFGRAELLTVDKRPLRIMLVKNPVGANEVLRTLALQQGQHDLLGILNDNVADGRDVSWIWDADFEAIAGRVRHVTCAGTRAQELALRLKYAGIEQDAIEVCEPIADALAAAAANRPPAHQEQTLYALPTYTAMLQLRSLLVRRGAANGRWS